MREMKIYENSIPHYQELFRSVPGPRPEEWVCQVGDHTVEILEDGVPIAMQCYLHRTCLMDGDAHSVVGLAYGSTKKEYEKQGISTKLIEKICEVSYRQSIQYAIIFCLDPLVEHYLKRKWLLIDSNRVWIEQPSGRRQLPNEVNCFLRCLQDGLDVPTTIDIQGRPW